MGLIVNTDCKLTPITGITLHKYYAFIDLLRTENGRQYSLNISNDATTKQIKVATRLKISRANAASPDNLSGGQDTSGSTGHCPGIGTQVYSVTSENSYNPNTGIISVKNDDGTVTHNTASNKKI